MRVAVTGAGGRLGGALCGLLASASFVEELLRWDVPEHDLDDADSARRLVTAGRPDVVVHTAAWTDVDGNARDPEVAMRRNGTATRELAEACVSAGAGLVAISTNEVFDGRRTDGRPYAPDDEPNPINPYGAAKLAGEQGAREAFGALDAAFARAAYGAASPGAGADSAAPPLAIVRTAWLFGPPGNDFPAKIEAAAARAAASGQPLKVVADEIGTPTYTLDLADAIVRLLAAGAAGRSLAGIHHVVNAGATSRAGWAREVLAIRGIAIPTEDVPASTWPRPSTPPAWGVLEPTPLPGGPLRDWHLALADYLTA